MDRLTRRLLDLSLENYQDEDTGDATEGNGWAALFRFDDIEREDFASVARDGSRRLPVGAILNIDTQGFKDSDFFFSEEELQTCWEETVELLNSSEEAEGE